MKSQPIAILSACLLWCGAIWAQPGGSTVDLKVPSEYRIAGITVLGAFDTASLGLLLVTAPRHW